MEPGAEKVSSRSENVVRGSKSGRAGQRKAFLEEGRGAVRRRLGQRRPQQMGEQDCHRREGAHLFGGLGDFARYGAHVL